MASSRWWLYVQAIFWRFLMRIGMFLHEIGPPRPPRPLFTRTVTSDDHCHPVVLHFYCPPNYHEQRRLGHRFPVAVNFHGGGFTLGAATDDSRWAKIVLDTVGAVMVSVAYRRAPEHPFPRQHAGELGLDVSRVALSGFSAGGNLAVTVPLRLRGRVSTEVKEHLGRAESTQNLLNQVSDLNIVAVFAWYPILDFEESRDHRRAMSLMPDKTLPAFFTTLFDEAYLPNLEDRVSPYASPIHASDRVLAEALPATCFYLSAKSLGKRPRAMLIEKARHAWDKSPNPWRDQNSVDILYRDACADMKAIFDR
ncbi:hypothetical protein N7519_010128 [Penicillium mononematosum]|uniref:uncharacterized protein n=1 Tax=Penicillium mononematosum TaxID=268346 RepID=UPI0025474F5B|nr:uncharacterized protein N7519_010128 [Penicillium mononematosum]KAJ6179667.1 hypothetical protein N7519_010128 [Penicillium mononematosum]